MTAVNEAVRDLVAQLTRGPDNDTHFQGTVQAVTTTGGRASVTLTIGAGTSTINAPGVFHDAAYTPTLADSVVFVFMGSTPYVLGKHT